MYTAVFIVFVLKTFTCFVYKTKINIKLHIDTQYTYQNIVK